MHKRTVQLAVFEDWAERRVVTLTASGGLVFIHELTTGDVTRDVFGSARHTHEICLTAPNANRLAQVVASHRVGMVAALRHFFGAGDPEVEPLRLVDLLDVLDWCGMLYTYTSSTSEGGVIRTPCLAG